MFKKTISFLLALGLIFSTSGVSFAAFTVREGGNLSIAVSATVPQNVGFGVNVNGDGTLNFSPTLTSPLAVADDALQVVFKNNVAYGAETFKSIIISTDNRATSANPKYTGTLTGSGLVNASATTLAAPLYWTVWQSEAEANAYDKTDNANSWPAFILSAVTDPKKIAGRTGDEVVDSRTHFFVTDKQQHLATGFTTAVPEFSPGFATVVAGVEGTAGSLANAPIDATAANAADDYADFGPGGGAANGIVDNFDNFNAGPQRLVTQDPDGVGQVDVWIRLACDFTGQPAGNYNTNTLRVELISQTP